MLGLHSDNCGWLPLWGQNLGGITGKKYVVSDDLLHPTTGKVPFAVNKKATQHTDLQKNNY